MESIHDSRKYNNVNITPKKSIEPRKNIDQQIRLKTRTGEEPQVHLSIHDSRKKGVETWPFSKRLILFYQNNRKIIKWSFRVCVILIIVLFPVWSGTLIGNWIKDFIGSIIHIVKTI